jgi:hypothetical protein
MTFTIMTKGQGDFTIEIDDEDWPRVRACVWDISSGSIRTTAKLKRRKKDALVCIQCFILQDIMISNDETIRHKDGNILNNKKENLKICSHLKEARSVKKYNPVIFEKESWCLARGKFCARVRFDRMNFKEEKNNED